MPEGDLKDVSQESYDKACESVLLEILRMAELRHTSILQIAAAADARAVQTVAGCAALAAAAFGGAAALVAADKLMGVAKAIAVAGGLLSIAAGCAAWAARPQARYRPPGMQPSQLWDDSVLLADKRHLLMISIGEAERGIHSAAAGTVSRGRAMATALWLASLAPMVSAAVWLALWAA